MGFVSRLRISQLKDTLSGLPLFSRPFSRRWLLFQSLLLLLLLATFVLAALQVHRYEDGVTRSNLLLNGSLPVPMLRFTPTSPGANLDTVAVIAHGYSADKELMSAFAVDLAKQGITTYTFDFPGHGASTVPYGTAGGQGVVRRLTTTLGEVVDYAQAHSSVPHPRIVLLGYSLGTIPVSEYALEHPQMDNLAATILVAGITGDHPTLTAPRNMLVLTGQFDLPGINDTARNLIASGCGVALDAVTDNYQCGSLPTAERRRIVLPGLDHISIVTAASTHTATINWLHATVDTRIGATRISADDRLHWLILAFFSAALALLPLLSLGAFALRLASVGTRASSANSENEASTIPTPTGLVSGWRAFGVCCAALAGAVPLLRLYLPSDFWSSEPFPFGLLQQMVSADMAIYFLIAGLLLWALLLAVPALRSALVWPRRHAVVAQVGLALALVAFLYITNGALSSFAWENILLSPARLWRAAIYALMIFPFLFGVRSLMVAAAQAQRGVAVGLDLGITSAILVAFGASIALNFARLSYLGILLPVIALAMLAFIPIAFWALRVVERPAPLLAIFQALLIGWALAATLPLIG